MTAAHSHFIDLPAGQFHYLAWGTDRPTNPPAVLLHANAGSAASWSRMGPALTDRFRVFAPDLRGHGASVKPPVGSYGLREAADDIRAFLDALELTEPLLIGHSWGAAVALVLATGAETNQPAPALSGLVLEDPPAAMSPTRQNQQLNDLTRAITLPAEDLREVLTVVHPDWEDTDVNSLVEGFQNADPHIAKSLVSDGARSGPLLPLLTQLTQHTLLLRADPAHGGSLSTPDWTQARQLLPRGSMAVDLPGIPHDIHRSQFSHYMHLIRTFTAPPTSLAER
ncbi:alpha/beta fold hydrolase [Streptomyces sp. AK02-04a]|uniref:alpha/beta fold hydrolase n=1 Tax=Streptomyces sp. AK02-04a TaxID=3028649 RepID=UPI0029A4933A|nr:alpha/beta fold hydrolase [Streptomyces sp. AK02-04a]MDX3763911.1 alpha/beta fold hydrolase [Streptomyces sp. AK02-04a]